MNPPPLPVPPPPTARPRALAAGERVAPTVLAVGALVMLGDFLFWKFSGGFALAIFAAAVASLMLLRHGRAALRARVLVPFAMLLASAWQTAVEISFTNVAVSTALFAILLGELCYPQLAAGWARWSESVVAWLCAAGRWAWFARALNEQPLAKIDARGRLDGFMRMLRIGLPAVLLLAVFAGIFSSGNHIFAEYLGRFGAKLKEWLSFDFSVLRFVFWGFLATLALVFIRPRTGAAVARGWAQPLGEWRRADAGVAFWQSVTILAALNALFFAVNTIDVVYLWMHTAVPAGMNGKQFLHEGVNSLITATILAGVVLTFLFQQSGEVTGAAGTLKGLAFAWMAQNLVLIAGVFFRLKLYVDTEEMTAKRVYVACFLLLVATGFIFLCAHVQRGRAASRLIWRNVAATFALFFVLQFLDVIGWVCRYNVERGPRRGQGHGFNIAYQLTLGPDAWPVLLREAETLPEGELRSDLRLGLRELARTECLGYARLNWQELRSGQLKPAELNWREQQLRRDRHARELLAWAEPLGELTASELESAIIKDYYRTKKELGN